MKKNANIGRERCRRSKAGGICSLICELKSTANDGKTLDVDSFEHQKLCSSKEEEMDAKMEMDGFLGCC